jgi:hypothetical protein
MIEFDNSGNRTHSTVFFILMIVVVGKAERGKRKRKKSAVNMSFGGISVRANIQAREIRTCIYFYFSFGIIFLSAGKKVSVRVKDGFDFGRE